MRKKHLALSIMALTSSLSLSAWGEGDLVAQMEVIKIIGSKVDARNLAGSGAVIDEKTIAVEKPTDINQLLKTVPGIYIREEDGFGLRPNIGIRGATSERSSKITLLEDGIMMAPAPYADPAAYYFPTTMRMASVEVLKGAPLLRHGPQTTGGVVNLVSTPIPEDHNGRVVATIGEYNSRDLHAYYGAKNIGDSGFSAMLETVQRNTDGFKDIDRSKRSSGFDIADYVLKLGWEGEGQHLLFKAQYSEEVSDETYLGLTEADFKRDPSRRYGMSAIDQMDNSHKGYSLIYSRDLTDAITATATAYYNDFARNWFKLGGGGALISAANGGDASAQAKLDGTLDVAGLGYKHNNRAYTSKGLDLNFTIDLDSHSVDLGVRAHEDEVDRFQPVEIYDQVNGSLVFQRVNLPGSGDNRVEQSEALTFWITDSWQVSEALTVNLALRHEDVDSSGVRYANVARSATASRSSNNVDEWLPGASFSYDLGNGWQVLAGVHKGFSPLGGGAQSFEEPETSINYEAGLRYQRDDLYGEVIGFYSDFDDKSENCSNARPCSNGATSGSFTTGEAVIEGVELQLGTVLELNPIYHLHLDGGYTYTQGEIAKDNPVNGFAKGDLLADVPEHLWSLRAGLESNYGWDNYLIAKYTDELCSAVGCNRSGGSLGHSEDFMVLDLISRYALTEAALVFLKVENLLDEEAVVSRLPDGARPNKPRTATVGIEYTF